MLEMNTDRMIQSIGMLMLGAILLVIGFDVFGRDSSYLMQMVGGSEGYVIEYELNGGDGDFNRYVVDYEETEFTLPDKEPTRASYVFTGWELEGEAGDTYFPGRKMPIDDDMKFIAQWEEGTHKIKYDLNGGTGNLPDDQAKFSTMYQLSTTQPTRTGYQLVGWKNSSDGAMYDRGDKLYITEGTTFKAEWKTSEYTIRYDLQGSPDEPKYPSSTIAHGRNFTISNITPKKSGFDFNGWKVLSSDQTYGVGDNFTASSNVTLVADWALQNQRVVYDLDGGSYSGVTDPPALTQYVGHDELYILSEKIPSKQGYVFNGWVNDHDSKTYQPGMSFRVKDNTGLKATWSLDRYAVTYDLDGGSGSFANSTVAHNSEYTVRTGTPTKVGHTFNGWVSSLDNYTYRGGDRFGVTSNTVLKADWKANSYTITFDTNGGDGTFDRERGNFNDTFVISSRVPVKKGQSFNGWRDASDGKIYHVDDKLTIKGDTKLVAQWKINNYTVKYNTNGGSGGFNTGSSQYGDRYKIASNEPTRSGYTFKGWRNNVDGELYQASGQFDLKGDTTLKAEWSVSEYTINYNLNGGRGSFSPETVSHGKEHTLNESIPERTGYAFKGWKNGSGSTLLEAGRLITPTSNMTLVAQWELDSHTVTYNLDGGDGNAHLSETHTVDYGSRHTITSEKPTKTGHDFVKWLSSEGNKAYNPGNSFTVSDDTILKAEWKKATFNIGFNLDGGSVINSSAFNTKAYTYGENVLIDPQVPDKGSIKFLGWVEPNTDKLYQPGDTYVAKQATTFKASWGHVDAELKYDANGGQINYAYPVTTDSDNSDIGWADINTGEKHIVVGEPSLTDHRFVGWEDVSSGKLYQAGDSITFGSDTTLRAKYTLNKFVVSFDLNNGVGSFPSQEVVYKKSFGVGSSKPSRTGYDFTGWKRSDNGSIVQAGQSFTMPNHDVKLTAQWSAKGYVVTYDRNGGSSGPSGNVSETYGDTFKINTTTPTRNGYTFVGWTSSLTNKTVQPGDTFKMPAYNVKLTAEWKANDYKVTYDRNGGSSGPSGSVSETYGDTFRINGTTPGRTGFTFSGWKRSDTNSIVQPGQSFTMPAKNVTLTAQWNHITYTVDYNLNGGSGTFEPHGLHYGDAVTVRSGEPTSSAYDFIGWTRSDTGARVKAGNRFSVTRDITLTAVWSKKTYTISYDGNASGVTGVPGGQTKTHGVGLRLSSAVPERSGYRFLKWTTKPNGYGYLYSPGDTFTRDTSETLYAEWHKEISYSLDLGEVSPEYATSSSDYGFGTVTGFKLNKDNNYVLRSRGRIDDQAIRDNKYLRVYLYTPDWSSPSVVNRHTETRADYAYTTFSPKHSNYLKTTAYLYPSGGSRAGKATYYSSNIYLLDAPRDTWDGDGDMTVDQYTRLKLPDPAMTRDNYSFGGWRDNASYKTNYEGSTFILESDTDFTAIWNPDEFNVTYNANGGYNPPSDEKVPHGSNYDVSSTQPSRYGYTFTGWKASHDARTYKSYHDFKMPTEDVTLTAQWSPKQYKIEFVPNGESTWDVDYDDFRPDLPTHLWKTHGKNLSLPKVDFVKRDWYRFAGWNYNDRGTSTSLGNSKGGGTLTSNIDRKLYAQWEKKMYTIGKYEGFTDLYLRVYGGYPSSYESKAIAEKNEVGSVYDLESGAKVWLR